MSGSQAAEATGSGLPAAPKAGSKEWIGLAVLALPCLLYSMDLTVLNLAVPSISADLKPSGPGLLWIVDIYGFVLAGALIPMGALGDRIGRRRLLLYGAAFFGLASILAAFSDTVATLIASRALLGLAAATLAPSTLSLIRNMFLDPQERTFAVGVWISSFSLGGAMGPVIGGILLEYFWWGSVFLINVPVMVLLLGIGPFLLPEFRDSSAQRTDIASAGLLLVAVLSAIYGMKQLAEQGGGLVPSFFIVIGLAVAVVFVRRQKRLANPFLDLDLFRLPAFNAAIGVNLLTCFTAFGSFLLIAQYLQLVIGLSPLEAGLWSAPSGLFFVLGSLLTPRFLRYLSPPAVMVCGILLAAAAFAVLAVSEGLAAVVVGFTLFSLGLAPVFTLTTDAIISAAPPERAGAASGISETSAEFGGALGIAVLGSLATAVYRGGMALEHWPLSQAAAATSRDTIAGALEVAPSLTPTEGAALSHLARETFTHAVHVAAIACVLALLLAAVVAGRLLRGARTEPRA